MTFIEYLVEQAATSVEELETLESKKKKKKKPSIFGWTDSPAGVLKYIQRTNQVND